MMSPIFRLSDSQKRDIAVACAIGGSRLDLLAAKVASQKVTIRRSKIEAILQDELGQEQGEALAHLVFGIAGTFRRSDATAKGVLDNLTSSINALSNDDPRFLTWDACRPGLERLLATQSVYLSAKAIDISYDFERVYITGRLLTSVRPVFDEPRQEIKGSTIVQTLRVEFVAPNGDQSSISIALDADDIKQLRKECDQALSKAEKAKAEMQRRFELEAIIPGEE
jgi:hypothetical protein